MEFLAKQRSQSQVPEPPPGAPSGRVLDVVVHFCPSLPKAFELRKGDSPSSCKMCEMRAGYSECSGVIKSPQASHSGSSVRSRVTSLRKQSTSVILPVLLNCQYSLPLAIWMRLFSWRLITMKKLFQASQI